MEKKYVQMIAQDKGELSDKLSSLLIDLPDEFPDWMDMDMEKAFGEFFLSLDNLKEELEKNQKYEALWCLGEECKKLFEQNDTKAGRRTIQQMKDILNDGKFDLYETEIYVTGVGNLDLSEIRKKAGLE
jgi:hypothetical protein